MERCSPVQFSHRKFSYFKYFLRYSNIFVYIPPGATQPLVGVYFTAVYRALSSSRARLLDHIQLRATADRTPLNE
jgi:hypothetical protein